MVGVFRKQRNDLPIVWEMFSQNMILYTTIMIIMYMCKVVVGIGNIERIGKSIS